jgi:hypothetical protein
MKRILLLVIGVLALAIAVPSAASAHGRHHGHHRHKAKHARVEHFGVKADVNDPSSPDAGTVDSFANGTLTIRLSNGNTVSGAVDADTVINCIPAQPTAAASHDEGDDDQADDPGDDDQVDDPGDDDQGDQPGDDDQGDQGDDDGDHGQAACDTSDLVAGATVHVAVLKLGGVGPEFKLVLLRS